MIVEIRIVRVTDLFREEMFIFTVDKIATGNNIILSKLYAHIGREI